MNDFRGPLPLDERDFAEVRRNVLGKIERPVRPFVFRFAFATAAVALLVFLLIPRPVAPPPLPAMRHVTPLTAISVAESPAPRPTAPPPKPKPHPRLVASKGAPPPDSEITMNIETADPNVRIIWITR